jgi:hypothetical protein
MTRRIESTDFNAGLPASEQDLLDELAAADDARWVVLIGEGTDAEKTLRFLRDLWADVETDGASCAARRSSIH